MPADIQAARARLLEAVQSGNWERVPAEADAYAAAVRADERRRTVDEALDAIKAVFGTDGADQRPAADWRSRSLAALERVQ